MGHRPLRRTEATAVQMDRIRRRVEDLERRFDLKGFYELKINPDRDNVSALLVPELALVFTGDNQYLIPIPEQLNGTNLVWAEAGISIESGGDIEIMVQNQGPTRAATDDMLSTPITIAAGDLTSYLTGPSSVIDPTTSEVATGDWVATHVTDDGDGLGEGLCVQLHFA